MVRYGEGGGEVEAAWAAWVHRGARAGASAARRDLHDGEAERLATFAE